MTPTGPVQPRGSPSGRSAKRTVNKTNFRMVLLPLVVVLGVALVVASPRGARKNAGAREGSSFVAAPAGDMPENAVHQQLQRFSLTGFDEKGKKFWNLEGQTAQIDLGQTVYFKDNATLRLKDGSIVRSDRVTWSQTTGILRTHSPVFVTRGQTRIRGVGAYGKLQENFIQINTRVEMIINPTSVLTCSGPMKIFYNENRMVFYRNVRVRDEKGTLTSKRMDVYFNPDTKEIREIIAERDVRIVRGGDTTRSERAVYTPATGAIRLEGSPEISLNREGVDWISGAPVTGR